MRKGYFQVGIDEAGRGPLAGPVVAAAVALRGFRKTRMLKDSKQLSPKKRQELYDILTNHPRVYWGVGVVSEKIIDKVNILQATKLAMMRALALLRKKNKKRKIGLLILDGRITLNSSLPQKSIVKADEKIFSCMAASVIAKVARDRMMKLYHEKYPRYGFDRHKGYPTDLHVKMLKKYGRCAIHRKSFNCFDYGSTETKKNKITAGAKKDASSS